MRAGEFSRGGDVAFEPTGKEGRSQGCPWKNGFETTQTRLSDDNAQRHRSPKGF